MYSEERGYLSHLQVYREVVVVAAHERAMSRACLPESVLGCHVVEVLKVLKGSRREVRKRKAVLERGLM